MEQVPWTLNQRFLMKREPDVGRIRAKSFAKKSRRRDTDHRKRMAFDIKSRSDDGRIGGVEHLPRTMAEDGHGSRAFGVILRRDGAASESANPESGKVAAGD